MCRYSGDILVLHFNNAFLCGTLSFSGCFHNNPVRKAGVEYYQMRHWRLGKAFVISPLPLPPLPPMFMTQSNGARIQFQNF